MKTIDILNLANKPLNAFEDLLEGVLWEAPNEE